jgi:hypothetical protein
MFEHRVLFLLAIAWVVLSLYYSASYWFSTGDRVDLALGMACLALFQVNWMMYLREKK